MYYYLKYFTEKMLVDSTLFDCLVIRTKNNFFFVPSDIHHAKTVIFQIAYSWVLRCVHYVALNEKKIKTCVDAQRRKNIGFRLNRMHVVTSGGACDKCFVLFFFLSFQRKSTLLFVALVRQLLSKDRDAGGNCYVLPGEQSVRCNAESYFAVLHVADKVVLSPICKSQLYAASRDTTRLRIIVKIYGKKLHSGIKSD